MPDNSTIESDLLNALQGPPLDEGRFGELALRVFEHQFNHNRSYRAYCEAKHTTPRCLSTWHDIPAVPTDAFKQTEHPLLSFPAHDIGHTFVTSGTTSELRGQHHFPTLELYHQSVLSAWRELGLPKIGHAVFLIAPPEHAYQSSLSSMMGVIADKLAAKSTWALDGKSPISIDAITRAAAEQSPLALFGTALAFLHFFDSLDFPVKLPEGSWAMETGGYKGSGRNLRKEDLYQKFELKLGLNHKRIINEYSMTELSSQYYSHGLDSPHTGPSWTRARVIDPVTDTDAKPGQAGYLVLYDLANLHSCMAIRTQDLAIRVEDTKPANNGAGYSFNLLGRDPAALPRGCSRAADYQLSQ